VTAIASTRTRRKNRRRREQAAALRAEIQQLRVERHQLARLALPDHPKGGFYNPLVGWEAQALAKRVLEEPSCA
jgi:hypothetical protein